MPQFMVSEIHTEYFMEGFRSHFTWFGQRIQWKWWSSWDDDIWSKFGVLPNAWGSYLLQEILGRMEQTVTVTGMAVVGREAVYKTEKARNRVGDAVRAGGEGGNCARPGADLAGAPEQVGVMT